MEHVVEVKNNEFRGYVRGTAEPERYRREGEEYMNEAVDQKF